MLIRSQDRETLINFNNSIVIDIMLIENAAKIVCSYSYSDYIIGRYSSKEKAMKVLDMIQDAYMEYKSGEIVGNGLAGSAYTGSYNTKESVAHGIAVLKGYGNEIRKSILFQMPEDGSVEV